MATHQDFRCPQNQTLLSAQQDFDTSAVTPGDQADENGKSAQAGAREPQSGRDPADLETWQLEERVCERVARQLRSVGDTLAWRAFNYERRYILTLCRNASPGPMSGKDGLKAELAFIEQVWKDEGVFALLHDLTNCLRIADATVFRNDSLYFHEIKTNPRRHDPAQLRRMQDAAQALWRASTLPGGDPEQRLYDLDTPFKTHLDLLAMAAWRAARDGIFTVKVPGSRALVALDLYGCQNQGWSQHEFDERLERQHRAVLRRARIDDRRDLHLQATSLDSVARDPLRVPWGIYPLDPVVCARLIGDIAVFVVEMSGALVARDLQAAGIDARWVRPPGTGEMEAGEILMTMTTRSSYPSGTMTMDLTRGLETKQSEMDRYLIELIDQGTWIDGIRHLLDNPALTRRPWPYYRDEHLVWR